MKRIRTRRGRKRTGTNLLEMVIVIGVASILMGAITLAMQHILRTNTLMRDRVRNSLAHERLGRMFRKDCHEAVSADAQNESLVLEKPGRKITYKTDGNVVTRVWEDADDNGSDRFYSTRDWETAIRVENDTATLSIARRHGGSKRTLIGKPRTIEYVAKVGTYSTLFKPEKTDTQADSSTEPETKSADQQENAEEDKQ